MAVKKAPKLLKVKVLQEIYGTHLMIKTILCCFVS